MNNKYLKVVRNLVASLQGGVDLFVNISAERQGRIRQHFTRQITEDLRTELAPLIREQVIQELRDELREEVVTEVHKGVPTLRERKAFQAFIREVELDAHAQASIASKDAERDDRKLKASRRWRTPLLYTLIMLTLPYMFLLSKVALNPTSFVFGLLTFLVGIVLLGVTSTMRHRRLDESVRASLETASDYLIVTEQAKAGRIFHAERLNSKAELDKLVVDLQQKKDRLDRNFNPTVSDLETARASVRHRIAVEEPAVLMDEFDNRLAEVESQKAER